MTAATLVTGIILTITGVVASIVSDSASMTSYIPSFVGVLLLVCWALARKESLRKHAIHAGMAIALIGALGSLMNVVQIGDLISGDAERPMAIVASLVMFVVLGAYLVLGIRSFIAARRLREASQA